MHIPDGVLDPATSSFFYLITIIYGILVIKYIKRKRGVSDYNISVISTVTALVFIAQMINWPIPGGTSLHLVGGGLVGVLLGPIYGYLSMSIVLAVQCFLFGDGGVSALGANIFNMAIIGVLSGYVVYRITKQFLSNSSKAVFIAGFLAGWLSLALAGFACGVEIGISRYFGFNLGITVPIMTGWHIILGLIEGFLTALILEYFSRKFGNEYLLTGGNASYDLSIINASMVLALFVSPLFSIFLANMMGYKEPIDLILDLIGFKTGGRVLTSPFMGYSFPFLPSFLGYILSGFIGVTVIYAIFIMVKLVSK